ncbi:MAG: Sec translocon accessory complex subunit YajC [Rhodocyclaceae bacterium]|nr:MAG: preprotein translocase subunit YajC [Rhodocyclaceae bacterium]MBE7421222.1 preprotein translocase subunit YajC [Zoogloeaceae bacterium]MBV6407734.1 Sec translocon accessory complex subunit YajC [Rhodocyclaceae bacterium]MCK6383052.1 preprotein translocase subunit YajC [Rhodocyclaceae bacterium]CAG0944826.1 Sec translocon accessory complex subunit YajC [Gammaproteobacteria bacterium]
MLISNAWAQAAPAAGEAGGLLGMLPILLMFVVLWFLMIRPQMKRAKEHKAMVEAMQKGDEVLTNGGIAGRITKLDETYIGLEIAENVVISVQRNAITAILPKGTLKAL